MSELCNSKRICEVGGQGFLHLPWGGDTEQRYNPVFRAIIYLIALMWCFLGVALIADVFMGAIEHITSKKVRKWKPEVNRHVTVAVWNPTVANLTLMALGSSAPEILLSVIELLGNDFYSGDLGPSTIVGSAAFNLFVIIAVCIMAIPDGELRSIKELPVYFTTAVFSLLAYAWLLVILQGSWSENVVEPWEGGLTLGFMPILIVCAFVADKGYLAPKSEEKEEEGMAAHKEMSKEELAQVEARIRRTHGEHLTESQVAKIIAVEHTPVHSRAHYRVAATRAITGGKRVKTTNRGTSVVNTLFQTLKRASSLSPGNLSPLGKKRTMKVAPLPGPEEDKKPSITQIIDLADGNDGPQDRPADLKSTVEFAALSYAVIESAGTREVVVVRKGNLNTTATVNYYTRDGTAQAGKDYEHTEGVLTFAPKVAEMKIDLKVVDDNAYENDEEFYVVLTEPKVEGKGYTMELGEKFEVSIVIIDDDLPGQLAFSEETMSVQESGQDTVVEVQVCRRNGCTGVVTCKYYSEDDSAKAGIDYEPVEGTLTFQSGQLSSSISITVKGSGRYERKEMFRVFLSEIEGGATFDPKTDGGAEQCILSVFIECNCQEAKARIDRTMHELTRRWEKSRIGHSNWREQFQDALMVNGKPMNHVDPEGDESGPLSPVSLGEAQTEYDMQPSTMDYVMHALTLPWKLLFALVPPTDYCGGWLCFGCSLAMIALVTAFIGDIAGLLGCVLTIPDEITAITFVALGTSLPDTFASKTAAVQDPTADASIGNVTGSNSVNVFLGLGLPWTMGSIYWALKDAGPEWHGKYGKGSPIKLADKFKNGAFVVRAGSLGFSVLIFTSFALAAMAMLYARRRAIGGELGGPRGNKMVSAGFLVMLWVLYVILSSWNALEERLCD